MSDAPDVLFGLPREVIFCSRCTMSNQRPSSYPEFRHQTNRITPTLHIDAEGVCDACRYAERKPVIDWELREKELLQLLDRHRKKDGSYDCICPGSGGKDSILAAHLLKYKYGMHPLTVTWPPFLYTEYGYKNFINWLKISGFDNLSFNQNGRVQRLLTRLSIENLLHPFQTFILGQKNLAPKIAIKYGIPLIFYGENEAEYGNPVKDNATSLRDSSYHAMKDLSEVFLAGVRVPELLEKHSITLNDLTPYFPADYRELEPANLEVHYLGYYVKWTPQEAYYYSVEHADFQARPYRSQGTYSKYNSIDDKIDDLHYFTTFIKYGLGRASYDAAQEIRNKHLTRDEGVGLVKQYDGEFPDRYFQEIMDYLEMKAEDFHRRCDEFRSPHLWRKEGGEWKLRHAIWMGRI